LGGHDHVYFYKTGKGNIIVKSGTDFRELTVHKVKYQKKKEIEEDCYDVQSIVIEEENKFETTLNKPTHILNISSELIRVTSQLKEDEEISSFIKEMEKKTEEQFKQEIGCLAITVDARFNIVRSQSCSISNFVADLIKIYMNTDVCLINSGSLRIDSIIDEGNITYNILF
jgi:2',3'-cyclic-nucleotide 2'-phosphodiesterase (5'-nucleotidase family)